MIIPDMPNVPPQNLPVMIAQANQGQANKAAMRTLGICEPSPNHDYSLENVIEPIGSAQDYLRLYEHRTVTGPATITVLQQPTHGILRPVTQADGNRFGYGRFDPADPGYVYLPENGYVGKDSAVILVDFGGGLQVKVKYYFQAVNGPLGNTPIEDHCGKKGYQWKISAILAPNGNSTLTSVEYQTPATLAADATLTMQAVIEKHQIR